MLPRWIALIVGAIDADTASHNAFANAVCYPGDQLKLRYRYRTMVLLRAATRWPS